MKRVVFGCVMALGLAACEDAGGLGGAIGAAMTSPRDSSAVTEKLVLGSNMSFEQCRAKGGFIIRDAGSPMTACDPNVLHTPAPADEFNNPDNNADELAAREAEDLANGSGG